MKTKPKKENRGGARANSGRPKNPQRQEFIKVFKDIRNHSNEVVALRDKKTGQIIKKKRVLFLLDALWTLAVNEKNVYAIKEYFDRAIGKSPQTIEIEDNEEVDELNKKLNKLIKNVSGNENTSGSCQSGRAERE